MTLKNDIADIIYQGVVYSNGWQLEPYLANNDCQDMADKIIKAIAEDTASGLAKQLGSMVDPEKNARLLKSWDSAIKKVDGQRGKENES